MIKPNFFINKKIIISVSIVSSIISFSYASIVFPFIFRFFLCIISKSSLHSQHSTSTRCHHYTEQFYNELNKAFHVHFIHVKYALISLWQSESPLCCKSYLIIILTNQNKQLYYDRLQSCQYYISN